MHSMRKKLISLIVVTFMMMAIMVPLQVSASDYSNLDWAKSTIDSFINRKIITADENGNIDPNKLLTRAEMATLINKAFGFTKTAEINYSDVQKADSYYRDLQIAKGVGYMKGDTTGTFRPNAPISRQEMAIIVSRILELTPNMTSATSYKDYNKMSSDEAKGAIGAMSAVDVLQGVSSTEKIFDPLANITKAQACVMVARAEKVYLELKDGARKYANANVTGSNTLGDDATVKNYNNVYVSGQDTTLKNIVIHGDLTIMASVGDGDVTLQNVTVKGHTYIYGGGKNSIKADNSKFATITIDKKIAGDTARLVLSGNSAVDNVVAKSGVNLEADAKIKVPNVTIPKDAAKNSVVTISATIGELTVQATVKVTLSGNAQIEVLTLTATAGGTSVAIDAGSVIGQALLNAAVAVTGKGEIEVAVVTADGVELGSIAATAVDSAGNPIGEGSSSSGSSSSSSSSSGGDSGSSGGGNSSAYIPSPQESLAAAFNGYLRKDADDRKANGSLSNVTFSNTSVTVTVVTPGGSDGILSLYNGVVDIIESYMNTGKSGINVTQIQFGDDVVTVKNSADVRDALDTSKLASLYTTYGNTSVPVTLTIANATTSTTVTYYVTVNAVPAT